MRCFLEYMTLSLEKFQPVCEIHMPMRRRLRGFTRFKDTCGVLEQDMLYYMEPSELETAEDLPVHFVYCSPKPIPVTGNHNWMCLRTAAGAEIRPTARAETSTEANADTIAATSTGAGSATSTATIAAASSETITDHIRQALLDVQARYEGYLAFLESLVSVMADKDMIQKTADLCYEFWGSPVSLYDTSFKLLASSSQYLPSDTRVGEVVHGGFMSVAAVKALRQQDRLKIYLSRDTYKITRPGDIRPDARIEGQGYGYIDVPVRAQGKVIACLALICTWREPDEMDADCLCEVAQFFSLALQRDGMNRFNAVNPFEALFRDVLSGSLQEEDVIEARLISLGKQLKKHKRIAVIPLGEEPSEGSTQQSDNLQSELRSLLPGAITAWYRRNIVLLLCDADKVVLEKENSRFSTYVRINSIHVGISRQFTSLTSIPDSYRQAQAALRLGTEFYPERHFFSYDEFVLTHELEIIARNADLKSFCLPALLELARSSKKGDEELLTTLYYYIIYAKNQKIICDLLHIHKSTLFYRINKIEEIIGVDLNDSFSSYMVMNSFHILRYTKEYIP